MTKLWGLAALCLLAACSFDRSGLQLGAGARDSNLSWPDRPDLSSARGEAAALDRTIDRLGEQPPAVTWKYRKKLALSDDPDAPLLDFPLLVRIAGDTELDKANTTAVSFRTLQGTPLAFEVELLNAGTLTAWVKVPEIATTGPNELFLYYGNTSAAPPPPASTVWSNSYRGVWHLDTLPPHDSGPAGLVSKSFGGVKAGAGKIGKGADFDKAPGSYLELGDGDLSGSSPFTIEVWFRAENAQSDWIGLLSKGRAGNTEWAGLWLDKDQQHLVFGWSAMTSGSGNLDGGIVPSTKDWHQAVGTFDGTIMSLYLDGGLLLGKPNSYGKLAGPSLVGTDRFESNPSLDGFIDEVRLSSVARSAAWISFQHANQDNPTFVTAGPQEPAP